MRRIRLRNSIYCGSYLCLAALVAPCWAANAALSLSAYRALGQPDLRQNAINMVGAATLNSPSGVAIDSSGHLYVTDTLNHRVLGWENVASFQNGTSAALVLGQQNFQQTVPNGIGSKGLNSPGGLAVDPTTGNLYVADVGNNRVVRFPHPFASPSNV